MFENIFANIYDGLWNALSPANLFYCALGVSVGTVVGIIPGIGTLAALSMLFPLTFYLEPTGALIMLAGIYYGASYGGSTTSILLNIPGIPANAVACLDGYPMTKQGRAGVALLITTIASFVGGSIGIILLMLFSPVISQFALNFGPAEYFSLMVLGLIAASSVSNGSPLKSLAMVVVGILVGLVGTDISSGTLRLTFGRFELADGISLVALAMGLFGVAEIITSRRAAENSPRAGKISLASMLPKRSELRQIVLPMLRGTGIGSFFGILPGTGGTLAAFLSYGVEKNIAKDKTRFGRGAIEGLAAPESANNAADQTSFVPTLTLGVPGTPQMAIILGVLMIHGISPGPTLISNEPILFWTLVMSFWIGNLLLLIINIPLIGLFVKILEIPFRWMFPAILTFICIGVYSVSYSIFDVFLVAGIGLAGYSARLLGFPAAPLLLGSVLGPMMEEYFRRAMLISRGNPELFWQRPLSATFLAISIGFLAWAAWRAVKRARIARRMGEVGA